jgi:tetratricopeptide (TPR) repeat protein
MMHRTDRTTTKILIAISASMLLSTAGGCKAVQKHRAKKAADREAKQLEKMQTNPDTTQTTQNQPDAQGQPQTDSQSEWTQAQRPQEVDKTQSEPESLDQVVMEIIDERPSTKDSGTAERAIPSGAEPMIDLPSPKTREEQSMATAVDLHASGNLEAALRELERAVAYNPRFTRAYIVSGDIYVELGEYERAERQYAAAVRNEPRNYLAQYRHANVLHKLGSLEESKRAYLRALSIRPSAFDANLGLSIVHLESGYAEQAIPYAQRAVRADPPSGRARMHLGNVYAAMDQHEEAIVEYQQAADMFDAPGSGLLLNLADSLNQLQRYAEMVGALEQLVLIDPDTVAYERLGSGYFRLRRYDEALAAFNSAVDLDPNHYAALNGIAVCELNNYLWNGKADGSARERAVDAMRRSLRLERQQPRIVELLRRYTNAAASEK